MAHIRLSRKQSKLRELAYREARKALHNAVEWIDKKDATWAQVNVQRALDLLKVIRDL